MWRTPLVPLRLVRAKCATGKHAQQHVQQHAHQQTRQHPAPQRDAEPRVRVWHADTVWRWDPALRAWHEELPRLGGRHHPAWVPANPMTRLRPPPP